MRHTVQGQKNERKSTADMSITIEIDFATLKKSSIKFNYVFYQVFACKIYVCTYSTLNLIHPQ